MARMMTPRQSSTVQVRSPPAILSTAFVILLDAVLPTNWHCQQNTVIQRAGLSVDLACQQLHSRSPLAARPLNAPNLQRCRIAGQSTRRALARACGAKHTSLDVDAMLHVISEDDSDTGSVADHADDDTVMDSNLPTDDLPYDNYDEVRNQRSSVNYVRSESMLIL